MGTLEFWLALVSVALPNAVVLAAMIAKTARSEGVRSEKLSRLEADVKDLGKKLGEQLVNENRRHERLDGDVGKIYRALERVAARLSVDLED